MIRNEDSVKEKYEIAEMLLKVLNEAFILTTDKRPKSFIIISGIFQVYVNVLVNAAVNVPSVPGFKTGVNTALVPVPVPKPIVGADV
jgi:hypothetical protein